MIIFIVPIKSAQISTNWEVFSILVERTMRSICQQTSSNFKVIAVCHEIPQLNFQHPSLEYIQVDFDPPTAKNIEKLQSDDPLNYRNAAKEADKAKKIMQGVAYAKKYNASHYMVVDADDCISKHIAKFAEEDTNDVPGWFISKGYIYNEGSNLIFLNKNTFNVLCGTCIIVKSEYIDQLLQKKPYPLYNHDFTSLGNGKEMHPLPFPGAIYSIGNTENYCSTPEAVKKMNSYSFLKKDFYENIVRKLMKYRVKLVTDSFRKEFGLTKLDFTSVFNK
ncbi:hypothetical protein [Arenibacter latericius]|uniref:hypothetical protein n=1 Tax=Arenibacter latericius TaxID=86104 RepID=UPI0003FE9188|nr:hypothetical protein [Arenibacter latericius]MDX1364919.1 hypothetical protein [Arenibacter latericius]